MKYRAYNPENDSDNNAALRILAEVSWFEGEKKEAILAYVASGPALVAEHAGEVECLVTSCPGGVRHMAADIPCSFITGVITGRVARRQGLAGALTAAAIAEDAGRGAKVSALGIFDQGYYDKLGYGTLGYQTFYAIDPSSLRLDAPKCEPRRIKPEDWEAIHRMHMRRFRGHGGVCLDAPQRFEAYLQFGPKWFGFAFGDEDGAPTHAIMLHNFGGEHGPLWTPWVSFSKPEQFLDLLGLIRDLGDQYRQINLPEPQGIQIQDFVDRPLHRAGVTSGARMECGARAAAVTQMRICDVEACLETTSVQCADIRFNLKLTDPIEKYLGRLDDRPQWHGCGGDYVITLGENSSAEKGSAADLPTLEATVGGFTRLWLGVRPAYGIALTGSIKGTPALIDRLSHEYVLPKPQPDWPF